MKTILIALFVLGCSKPQPQPAPPTPTPPPDTTEPVPVPTPPPPPAPAAATSLATIDLPAGTAREDAEKKIAAVLGKPSTYSPYGNNLRGGTVEYTDGTIVLEVVYKAGTPAPWVVGKGGVAEHYPPVDESVTSFRIIRK